LSAIIAACVDRFRAILLRSVAHSHKINPDPANSIAVMHVSMIIDINLCFIAIFRITDTKD